MTLSQRLLWLAVALAAVNPVFAQTDAQDATPADASADTVAPAKVPEPGLDSERLFERATDAIGEGKLEEAASLLEQVVATGGDTRLAPEALFLLGELYEEQLDRPTDAARAYREIGRKHSQSRVAIAARERLASLEQLLGEGHGDAERLSRFLSIRRNETEGDATSALAQAEALLAEDPEWISAAQVRLWMAGVALRDGQRAKAEELYVAAMSSSDADVVFEARMAASKIARERGAYAVARERAEAIDPAGVPGRLQARRETLEAIDRAEVRAGRGIYAIGYLVLFPLLCLGIIGWRRRSVRGVLGALWPPPTESIYLAPVLVVFVLAAFTGHVPIAHAVVLVSIIGFALSWIGGSALRSLPRSWLASIALSGGAALGVACAFYLALLRGGLIDLIITTVRFGPDV